MSVSLTFSVYVNLVPRHSYCSYHLAPFIIFHFFPAYLSSCLCCNALLSRHSISSLLIFHLFLHFILPLLSLVIYLIPLSPVFDLLLLQHDTHTHSYAFRACKG
jgi:hypothetical protein